MNGFIDLDEPTRRRLERIELILDDLLAQTDQSVLSPEVQEVLAELRSTSAVVRDRARRRSREWMNADPLVDGER